MHILFPLSSANASALPGIPVFVTFVVLTKLLLRLRTGIMPLLVPAPFLSCFIIFDELIATTLLPIF